MEILNNAITQVCGEIPEDQWSPSRIEVAVSTVTVTNIKVVRVGKITPPSPPKEFLQVFSLPGYLPSSTLHYLL